MRCVAPGRRRNEIEFVEFVQWTADRQLGRRADLAKQLGMKVGLYLDVAVGVQADGFDAWNEQVAISAISASARRPIRSTPPARPGALPASMPLGSSSRPLRRTATCCAPRCATPAPSGSTMCSG